MIIYICIFWHKVEPNQDFQGLVCEGADALPSRFIEDAFRDGYGMFSSIYWDQNLNLFLH